MSSLLERLAEDLAKDALKQEAIDGEEGAVDAVSKALADTSTTFQETFLTAIRYYKAEARARELLPNVARSNDGSSSAILLEGPKDRQETEQTPEEETGPHTEAQTVTLTETEDEAEVEYAEAEMVDDDEDSKPSYAVKSASGNKSKPNVSAEDAENPMAEPEITGPKKAGR